MGVGERAADVEEHRTDLAHAHLGRAGRASGGYRA
jgi:hypothetical protein